MSIIASLRSRGQAAAGRAVGKLLSDPRRVEQLGELVSLVQKGRKAVETAQEAAVKAVGLASSGDLKATSKRLAKLRRSARQLDVKLGKLSELLEDEAVE